MMSARAIWVMAVVMGLYQGLNPASGWLLAVGSGLQTRSRRALLRTAAELALGHFLAMLALLLPLSLLLGWLLGRYVPAHAIMAFGWGVNFLLIAFALYKLRRPRHPRFITRIGPHHWVRWSFWMGLLHCGSPLMMVPVLVNLILLAAMAHPAAGTGFGLALTLSAAMALPLLLTATLVALWVYHRLGLAALTRYWLNFELVWFLSFFPMAAMGLLMA